ncbi:hypothetical protein ACP70R_049492 [Stipagrostis hirtigluma subsp. patula]
MMATVVVSSGDIRALQRPTWKNVSQYMKHIWSNFLNCMVMVLKHSCVFVLLILCIAGMWIRPYDFVLSKVVPKMHLRGTVKVHPEISSDDWFSF